ncbi:MAG TPA: hypothetical protein ENN38_07040 [Actinobacteria bacterium]|nr:hypothetical protein [Actinomycetota bacterium]
MVSGPPHQTRIQSLLIWAPPLLWMVAIYFFSSLPASGVPSFLPDYVFHFFEYTILGILFLRAFEKQKETSKRAPFLTASLCIVYAALDELHQFFVPTRDCSLKDFAVDVVAILFIIFVALLIERGRRGKTSKYREKSS